MTETTLDSCDAPDTVTGLDCSSVYDTEEIVLDVANGQTVFIVVDGLNNAAATFQISAELD